MNTKVGLYIALVAMLAIGGCVFVVSDESDAVDGTATFTVGGATGEWAVVKDNLADGSTIVVASSGNFSSTLSISNTGVTLDLNGQTINFMSNDTSINSAIYVNQGGSLTIVDSGSAKGAITTSQDIMLLNNWGTTMVDGITMELDYNGDINRMIQNVSNLTIRNGELVCHSTNVGDDNAIVNFKDLTLDNTRVESDTTAVYNGYLDDFGNVTCNISGSDIISDAYGVAVFGKGIDDGSELDNNSVVANIENSSIKITGEGQGIGTNASGGANAGHTITLRNVDIDASNNGCGIYAPSIGVYNIIGGHIIGGSQGIRISAGELNISDGAKIESTASSSIEKGLVSGGSGGAGGAIVVGKAGSGYVGDIDINIDGASILNSNGDAIVMSDVYMGTTYQNNEINFDFNSGSITGDIQNITSTTQSLDGKPITSSDAKPASGNAHLNLNGGDVYGNVNQSSGGSDVIINGAYISGNVTQSEDSPDVVIESGLVSGTVPDTVAPSGTVTFVIMGNTTSFDYYGNSITLLSIGEMPGYTIGWSTDNQTIMYGDGATISNISGDITLYFMMVSDEEQSPDTPPYPWWDDDDEYVPPIVPVQPEDSGDDDTTTIVACAAAAVVAALIAAYLIIDRRQ